MNRLIGILVLATLAGFGSALLAQCERPAAATDTATLRDSFITRAAYDLSKQCLYLFFTDGSVYSYSGVPANVFRTLKNSDDPGAEFNAAIRNSFQHLRLPESPPPKPPRVPDPPVTRQTAKTATVACAEISSMTKRDVVSEALDSVAYDPRSRCLVLYFDDGTVYRYGSVPQATYDALMAAKEPGPYFNKNIWSKFPFNKVR